MIKPLRNGGSVGNIAKKFMEDIEASLGDVPLCVLECPHNAIDYELLVFGGDLKKCGKGMKVDTL